MSPQCRKRVSPSSRSSVLINCTSVHITHHFVHIAIKMARMKDFRPEHLEYLKELENTPHFPETNGTTNRLGGTTLSHHRIIGCHFMLKVCRTFTPGRGSPSFDFLTHGGILGLYSHLLFIASIGTLRHKIRASFDTFQC